MTSRLSFLITAMLTSSMMISAATYFCSPNGSGNGSSYNTPCSFSTGVSKLQAAGDTLYLLGGQYNLGETTINKKGSSAKRVVISGYPGEAAILDFRSTPYGTRGLKIASASSYLHIKNLTLRYSGKNNLYCEGSNCLFENLDIYGSADTGCQMKTGGNNVIKNVDSHDNFDYKHTNSNGQADYGGNADGFADKQHSGASNTYIGCRSWNNSDDGWDFFQRNNSASATPTIIENCICYQNGPAEYDMRNHARYQVDKTWFDQVNGSTITNRYGQSQVVSLEHYPNHGNGNGFKIGGDYTTHNVTVHHSLAVANTVKGFDQNNNNGTMRIYNNTGYDNGNNMGFHNASNGTLYIQNCVSFRGRGNDMLVAQTVAANNHNSWNTTGVTCNAADFQSLDTTEILRPRQADGSYQEGLLLRLAAGSDLIDAGTNVGYAYMGQAPDLGCYESDGIVHPALWLSNGTAMQTVLAGDSIAPIVITWSGCDTKPTTASIPTGITRKVSNNNHTLTFTGVITTPGVYTFTTTTACGQDDASLTITINVRSNDVHRVAYVTIPDAGEDALILQHLAGNDSIVVVPTDASDATVNYATYDAIIISPKPSSTAAGLTALEGYDKPMLVLKPFLFKNTVWNWGNSVNTSDLNILVSDTTHALFSNICFGGSSSLQIFSKCNTNAVTAITTWTNVSGTTTLAAPASQATAHNLTIFPTGTDCNGTTLTEPLIMFGVSEYSTTQLTDNGLQLIENCLCYLLGLPLTQGSSSDNTELESVPANTNVEKVFREGCLYIQRNGILYSITGQLIK